MVMEVGGENVATAFLFCESMMISLGNSSGVSLRVSERDGLSWAGMGCWLTHVLWF